MTVVGQRLIEAAKQAADMAKHPLPPDMEARVRAAADAILPEASAMRQEANLSVSTSVGGISLTNYRLMRAALRAAFPELFDGSAWLAPMEASPAMRVAGWPHFSPLGDKPNGALDFADRRYTAMRDAHLSLAGERGEG